MAANLNSAMLDSSILPRKKTSIFHSHSTWWWQPSWILPFWLQPFCTKNISLIHFDSTWWLAAILNSTLLNLAMVDSTILHKTLTQTNLIWLKLIHSHSNWWWQPSWNLPCWIWDTALLDSDTLLVFPLRFTQKHSHSRSDSDHLQN